MTTNERKGHEVLAEAANVQTALKTYAFLRQLQLMDKGDGVQLLVVNQATGLQLYINSKILDERLKEEFNKLETWFLDRNIDLAHDLEQAEKQVREMFQNQQPQAASNVH